MSFVLLALFALAGDPALPAPEPAVPLVPAITRAEIEAHVRFLAADERAGRVTGTPEAELCARYLAGVLERQGLQPAGDDGTFLQRVPLVSESWSAPPELTLTLADGTRTTLVHGRDFDGGRGYPAQASLKLVVARDGASLPGRADAGVALFFDAPAAERRRAFEAGKLDPASAFGLFLVPGSEDQGERSATTPRTTLERRGSGRKEAPRAIRVHGDALAALRRAKGGTLAFDPQSLAAEIVAHNVAARIAGSGRDGEPDLAGEAVVVTAHYDHIAAHGPAREGEDHVYNGADDDASGTAAVLEIAGAMAQDPPPARTVVFVLVTGEEVGLLGTDEYLERPVVPLAKTVANLNFEMIGRPDEKVGGAGNLWFTGFELSNLGDVFASAKLAIRPDPYPNQHFFERSDNIAFVRKGIVGQTFSSYNLHADYHRPSDEVDKLDFEHMEKCTRAGLEAVRLVASGTIRPAWKDGRAPRTR